MVHVEYFHHVGRASRPCVQGEILSGLHIDFGAFESKFVSTKMLCRNVCCGGEKIYKLERGLVPNKRGNWFQTIFIVLNSSCFACSG